ncbi:MAG: pirin family protein [Acholeplasmatales bacterium]|nr:pirin family protein [Acholeplasmatales bacterium]
MYRQVTRMIKGYKIKEGDVSLFRVLGKDTIKDFDPFIKLDAIDSKNYEEFKAGFPIHYHRGIYSFTLISKGNMNHIDNKNKKTSINEGDAQFIITSSGVSHKEAFEECERLLGLQLWINMPSELKMKEEPLCINLLNDNINVEDFKGGKLRLLAGNYKKMKGLEIKNLHLDLYDIFLKPNKSLSFKVSGENKSAIIFSLLGVCEVSGTLVEEKTCAKLGEGNEVIIKSLDKPIEVIFACSNKINEPLIWDNQILMNSKEELKEGIKKINNDSFIKSKLKYESLK